MLFNDLVESVLERALNDLIRLAQRDHLQLVEVVGLVPGHRSRSFQLCRRRFYPSEHYKPKGRGDFFYNLNDLPFCRMGASGTSLQVATRPNEEAATSRPPAVFKQGARLPAPMSVRNGLLATAFSGRNCRDDLSTVSAVDSKVAIQSENDASWIEFRHSDETGVRERHGDVRKLLHQHAEGIALCSDVEVSPYDPASN